MLVGVRAENFTSPVASDVSLRVGLGPLAMVAVAPGSALPHVSSVVTCTAALYSDGCVGGATRVSYTTGLVMAADESVTTTRL